MTIQIFDPLFNHLSRANASLKMNAVGTVGKSDLRPFRKVYTLYSLLEKPRR